MTDRPGTVTLRRTGGPMHGEEIQLRPGQTRVVGPGDGWARVRALDEGVVVVEALRPGTLLDGDPVRGRAVADLAVRPRILTRQGEDDGFELELAGNVDLPCPLPAPDSEPEPRTDLVSSAPLATAALEFDDAPVPPAPAPTRLELAPPSALPSFPSRKGPSPARQERRTTRRSRHRRQRVQRPIGSAVTSVAVHLAVLLFLGLLLSVVEWVEPEPTVTVSFHLGTEPPPDPDRPEATPGTDEAERHEGAAVTEKTANRQETDSHSTLAAASGEEAGLDLDELVEERAVGTAGADVGAFFQGRVGGRARLLAAGGGDGETEGAVRRALEWLARHQNQDGSWDAFGFDRHCLGPPCTDPGRKPYVTATTALALLPYLGGGHTHLDGPWKDTVRAGLTALLRDQRKDGSFAGGDKRAYATAFATLALAEAYGLTGSRALHDGAERAVRFWIRTQSEEGGWRYRPGSGAADTSVTGWVALSLAAARKAGIQVPDLTLMRCRRWFREHTRADGDVGYQSRGGGPTALLGVGYFVPVMLGEDPERPHLRAVAARVARRLPNWSRDATRGDATFGPYDPFHWYYGSLASFQQGGAQWRGWNARLKSFLLTRQIRTDHATGSWDPRGATGMHGGRVVMTALCALSLEVYYRYPRVVGSR